LLVDDEENIRTLYGDALEEVGYNVITASNGDRALELIEKSKSGGIDLVVLDIKMPGLDGVEVLTRIKNDMNPDLPVILLSAYDTSSKTHVFGPQKITLSRAAI